VELKVLVTLGREKPYVERLHTGDTVKYQKMNEKEINTIAMRSMIMSFSVFFRGRCKFVHLVFGFDLVTYYDELLILYALLKMCRGILDLRFFY